MNSIVKACAPNSARIETMLFGYDLRGDSSGRSGLFAAPRGALGARTLQQFQKGMILAAF